jgi:hypothetical protein
MQSSGGTRTRATALPCGVTLPAPGAGDSDGTGREQTGLHQHADVVMLSVCSIDADDADDRRRCGGGA